MIMSFIKMVENQNDVKVKQIRTDNRTKFRNHELKSFCDEKRISQNFSSPYTPEQNGVAERKNRTLIEAARTMDHLGKFDAKANDGYFLGYSFVSKAFRVFNTRRQQIEETYHVTCDEKNHAPEVIALNEPDIPHTKNTDDPPGNNTEVSGFITESLVPDVTQSHISNQASTSSHHVPQDRFGDPVARMKAIRIFLSFTTYMNFKLYLMDVKSAFLNEKLKEEVYVKQPFGFETSEFPDYVYLKEMSPSLSDDKGISICQEQYTKNVLKKYEISDSSSLKTPMVPPNNLGPDLARKPVNKTLYRGMIGSLIILEYLKGTPSLGLYNLKCSGFDLKGYSYSHYVGCNMDRKSTSGVCQILGGKLVCWSAKKQQRTKRLKSSRKRGNRATKQQTIKYAPYWNNMTVDNVTFQTNNVVVVYQNYLREFWSTDVAYEPCSSKNKNEKRPLREFLIKFSVLNGERPLTLDFNTFFSSTGFDYNNGKYVAHPTPETAKRELGKIAINPSYLDKTPVLKNSFLDEKFGFFPGILSNSNFTKDPSKVTDIELTAMIVMNYQRDSVSPPPFSTKKKKGKSQTVTSTLPQSQGPEASGALSKKRKKPKSKKPPIETKITPTKLTEGFEQSFSEGTTKITLHPEGSLGDKDSGGHIPPADMKPIHPTITEPLKLQTFANVQAFLLSKDEMDQENDKEEVFAIREDMDEDPQVDEEVRTPSPKEDQPEPSHEQHEEATVSYVDLKTSIKEYYNENVAHRDQTNKLVETTMSAIDKRSTTIKDLYKGMNIITQHLKDINTTVKDDPATNKKIDDAIETFAKIFTNTTEVLSLVKGFDFSTLQSSLKDLQAHALKQEEVAAWAKSSTNMAWNLGSKMTANKICQTALKSEVSSLRQDISKIKSMMTNIYQAFKGQSSSAPSSSVTSTLALTNIPANVEGENATNTTTEEPHSHTEAETEHLKMAVLISSITPTKADEDSSKKLVHASSIVRPDLDEQLKLNSWPEVIKVVQEEAEKIRLDSKKISSAKVEFGITELDDLGLIIQKKKNSIVKDLITSLSKRYERFKKIPKELGIPSALPTPAHEQASSQTSGRKTKHMELEPKVKVPGLECDRSLPEAVPFVNNMVIEEPEYGIFFMDVFGDQAFQRWSDIHKVEVDSLVMALMVKTKENARFSLKPRKLIADHPDQEKLKSKKVNLEALGYQMD
nr:hypothetical protein [Tanacetum cinerariifolium]